MPFVPTSYTVDKVARLIVETFTGTVSMADVMAHLDAPGRDPDYSAGFRRLTDHSLITPVQATGNDMRMLAAQLPMAPDGRRALVVASDLHFGFGRMVQQHQEGPGREVAVFRDRETVLQWLNRPSDS